MQICEFIPTFIIVWDDSCDVLSYGTGNGFLKIKFS